MANRLLRYELALLRNSFADAFERKRDQLLLLLFATLAFLWLRDRIGAIGLGSMSTQGVWLAALAGPAGYSWHRLLALRLAWLAEHGAVAPAALEAGTRRLYLVASHALAAIPLLLGAALLGFATGRAVICVALAVLAYAAGAGLAAMTRPGSRRAGGEAPAHPPPPAPRQLPGGRRAAFRAILRSQTFGSTRPGRAAVLILTADFALTAAAAWLSRGQPDALRFAAALLPAFLCLLLVSRIDAGLIGFLPFVGYGPRFVGLAVSALPAAGFVAAAAAILAVHPIHFAAALIVLALPHLAFIAIGLARVWLYPGRHARSVDLQLQIEFAGLVLVAILLPPLALVALVWRLWTLHRHYASLLWTQL